MMRFNLLYFLIVIKTVLAVCPPQNVLNPCTCTDDNVLCGGTARLELSSVFDNIRFDRTFTQRHFKRIEINNTFVTEIGENSFKEFTFEVIYVHNCANLTKIDPVAFTQTNLVTKELQIYENYQLKTEGTTLFDIISKFKSLEYVYLEDNTITEIPRHAFKPVNGYQDRLAKVYIRGNGITTIGEDAFYYLNNVNILDIFSTSIKLLSKNSFRMENRATTMLTLLISGNAFTDNETVSSQAFDGMSYPCTLIARSITTGYLKRSVFLPFLLKNSQNIVEINEPLDCDDCRNFWIKDDQVIQTRIRELRCKNGKQFTDNSNFKNC